MFANFSIERKNELVSAMKTIQIGVQNHRALEGTDSGVIDKLFNLPQS